MTSIQMKTGERNLSRLMFLLVVFLTLCNNAVGITNEPMCRDGWHKAEFGLSVSKCIKIVKQKMTWSEASNLCHEEVGALLNNNSHITMLSNQSLLSLTVEDGSYPPYWIGLHVDENMSDQLSWDGFPPRRFEETYRWKWKSGEPNSRDCMAIQILPPPDEYVTYDVNAAMLECDKKKFFMCQADLIDTDVHLSSGCEEGWVSNNGLAACYKVFNEKLKNFQGAAAKCGRNGGSLAAYASEFDKDILGIVASWFNTNDGYFFSNVFSSWVTDPASELCTQLIYDNNQNTWIFSESDCSSVIPFMCQMPKGLKNIPPIELSIKAADQDELSDLPLRTLPPVTCEISRHLTELEELHFYKNGELIDSERYVQSENRGPLFYTNVTFPQHGYKRSIGSFFPNRDYIGYYWCSIVTRFPFQILNSARVLVQYASGDMLVFQGKASLNNEVQKDEYVDFNLYGTHSDELRDAILNIQSSLYFIFYLLFIRIDGFQEFEDLPIISSDVSMTNFRNGSEVDFTMYLSVAGRLENVYSSDHALLLTYRKELKKEFPDSADLQKKSESDQMFRTVSIFSTVSCRKKKFNGIAVPQTAMGSQGQSAELCIKDNTPLVVASCEGDYYRGAHWGKTTIKEDCIPTNLATSPYTSTLESLTETVVTLANLENTTTTLANLSADSASLVSLDLIYISQILENVGEIQTFDVQTVEEILNTVDNVLEVPQSVVDQSRIHGSAPNRIVEAVERISEKIDVQDGQDVKIVRGNVALQVWKSSGGKLGVIGLKLNSDNNSTNLTEDSLQQLSDENDVTYPSIDTALFLPRKVLTGDSKLVMHVYSTDKLFKTPSGKLQQYRANSRIIAAKLLKDKDSVTDLGSHEMVSVFLPIQEQEKPTCGYWNYSGMNSAGAWSTDGCYFDGYVDGRAVCKCDHLTNFAILFDYYGNDKLPDAHKLALHIITIIGVSLSVAGLSLTVLAFILLKPMRNGRAQQTLFNLALSMLCSLIMFITGIIGIGDRAGCIVVAVLLHYFILVSFMWMLMEAVLQYLRFVKVIGTYIPNFMWKTAIPSWGLPAVPVAVVCGIDYNLYHGGYEYCWMSLTPFYYSFALPVGIIIVINLVVFVMVIVHLFRSKGLRSNQSERQRQLRNFQALLSVFFLLGLTWIFGYLTIEDARIAFKYIFCVAGSLQGFFIFVLLTSRDKQVRKSLRRILCCKTEDRPSAYSSRDSADMYSKSRSSNLSNTSITHLSKSYIRKGSKH